jgi:hypothetical protein
MGWGVWARRLLTLLVVTAISTVVWFVTEAQTLRKQTVTVQLTLSGTQAGPGAPGLAVRAAPAQRWTGAVELQLDGATGRLAQLGELVREAVVLTAGRELPATPGEHTVDLRAALRSVEVLRDSGVTIAAASPESLRIEVDRLEVREVPVRVDASGAELEGVPTTQPATAWLVAPAALLYEAGDAAGEVVGRITADELNRVPAGRPETLPAVRLEPPEALRGGWSVRVEPTTAAVTLTVRSRTGRLVVPRLPVQVMLAPSELGRWSITVAAGDRDMVDVTLTGPADAIERVRRREVVPVAVVQLSFEELEAGVTAKDAVVLGLPAGVRAEVADRSVRLEVRPAEEPAPAGPGGPAGPSAAADGAD